MMQEQKEDFLLIMKHKINQKNIRNIKTAKLG
jgi:hypothetical protein